MLTLITQNNSDVLFGDAIEYFSDSNYSKFNNIESKSEFKKDILTSEEFWLACLKSKIIYVPVWLSLYKKNLLIDNNINFKLGILHEDEEFTPKVLLCAKKISIYKKAFYMYRQRPNSIMTTALKNPKMATDFIQTLVEL